jgi:hypothetical protein
MSTMILEVYDALKSAGAPEEKAQAAATVLANTESLATKADIGALSTKVDVDIGALSTKVEADISALSAKTDAGFTRIDGEIFSLKLDLAVVKAELALVKWLVSGIGFGVVLLVLKSFWPGH